MIDIFLYSFNKRENSTARPLVASETLRCTLKEPCSIIAPTVKLNMFKTSSPAHLNYAYIPEFRRYYFIENWEFLGGLWYASMTVDSLASWREAIGSSELYVLRSSARFNGAVTDMKYPTTSNVSLSTTNGENPWATTFDAGKYVVGIINGDAGNIGAVSYYVFTPQQFAALKAVLMGDTGWLGVPIDQIPEEALKVQFNPFQYITSVNWFPFNPPEGGAVTGIQFGWWILDAVSATRLGQGVDIVTCQLSIPKHPQAARGSYLNMSPYSRYTLNMRPFGTVALDSAALAGSNTLYVTIYIDCITGTGTLYASPNSGLTDVIAITQAQVGVPIQLAQIARDYLGVAATSIGAGGAAMGQFLTGNVAGAISTAVSGIASSVAAAMPQMQTSGGNGSISDFIQPPRLYCEFFKLVDENNADVGRPLCEIVRLDTIPGFIMVSDADISLPATANENRTIKNYMKGGFFYE